MYGVVELYKYGFIGFESAELKEIYTYVFDLPIDRELIALMALAVGFRAGEEAVVLSYGEEEEAVIKPVFKHSWRGGEVSREGAVERPEELVHAPTVRFITGKLLGESDIRVPTILETDSIRVEYDPFYGVYLVTRKANKIDEKELAVLFAMLKSEYGV